MTVIVPVKTCCSAVFSRRPRKRTYNNLTYRYLGVSKTIELISREYVALKLRSEVEKYIKKYILY